MADVVGSWKLLQPGLLVGDFGVAAHFLCRLTSARILLVWRFVYFLVGGNIYRLVYTDYHIGFY